MNTEQSEQGISVSPIEQYLNGITATMQGVVVESLCTNFWGKRIMSHEETKDMLTHLHEKAMEVMKMTTELSANKQEVQKPGRYVLKGYEEFSKWAEHFFLVRTENVNKTLTVKEVMDSYFRNSPRHKDRMSVSGFMALLKYFCREKGLELNPESLTTNGKIIRKFNGQAHSCIFVKSPL